VKVRVKRLALLTLSCQLVLAAAAAAQASNARQTAEAAMLKADRDFNRAMADHDLNRFVSFVATDAVFDSAEGRGKDAVAKAWGAVLRDQWSDHQLVADKG
jgi:ketosteroid isomerase-like protein